MTNPFKQKQRKQVTVKLTSKHYTTFPPNRIKIGAYIIFLWFFFFVTPLIFITFYLGGRNRLCIMYLAGNELRAKVNTSSIKFLIKFIHLFTLVNTSAIPIWIKLRSIIYRLFTGGKRHWATKTTQKLTLLGRDGCRKIHTQDIKSHENNNNN
jgi:hypothetical protein